MASLSTTATTQSPIHLSATTRDACLRAFRLRPKQDKQAVQEVQAVLCSVVPHNHHVEASSTTTVLFLGALILVRLIQAFSSNQESLKHVGNDLVAVQSRLATTTASAVQELQASLSTCLACVETHKEELARVVLDASDQSPPLAPQEQDWSVCVVKTLQSLQTALATAVAWQADFLSIWQALVLQHAPTCRLPLAPEGGISTNSSSNSMHWEEVPSAGPAHERRLVETVWKLAHVVHYHHDNSPNSATRNFMESAATAIALVGCLAQLVIRWDPLNDTNATESPAKRPKPAPLLETVLQAAHAEASFLQWSNRSSSSSSTSTTTTRRFALTVETLGPRVHDLLTFLVQNGTENKVPIAIGLVQHAPQDDILAQFIQSPHLSALRQVVWSLPETVDRLYQAQEQTNGLLDPAPVIHWRLEVPLVGTATTAAAATTTPGKTTTATATTTDASSLTQRRAVTPPLLTAAMELNEWVTALIQLETVVPNSKLRHFLDQGGDWVPILVPALNKCLQRLCQEPLTTKAVRVPPVSLVAGSGRYATKTPGQVQVAGDMDDTKQWCVTVVALFYHALEAILVAETKRLGGQTSHPAICLNPVFYQALLACCCACTKKAIGVTSKLQPTLPWQQQQTLQIHSVLQLCDSSPHNFLKVSESFCRALSSATGKDEMGSPLPFLLPRLLQKEIKEWEVHILDSLLWARSAAVEMGDVTESGPMETVSDKIEEFQQAVDVTLWPPEVVAPSLAEELEDAEGDDEGARSLPPPPTVEHEDYAEYRCLGFLIRKLLRVSHGRIKAIAAQMRLPADMVVTQVYVAFRYLIRNRIELLFDRHVDQWILCCFYGVSKSLQLTLTFGQLIEAYVVVRGPELGDVTCQRIVRHIKVETGSGDVVDNVIALYNKVFVPEMKEHLLKSRSLKRKTAMIKQKLEAAALEGRSQSFGVVGTTSS